MQNTKTSVLAIFAVLLTAATLWLANRPEPSRQAAWDDVLLEGKRGGYRIMTTDELARRYQEERGSFLLVDTRQEWEFRTGHIEGAVNFPMKPTAWSRWRAASPLASFLGPDKDRPLVFY